MGRTSWLGRTALFAVLLVSVATGLLVTTTASPALAFSADDVATGDVGSCAVMSGAAWCWGYNEYGSVGDGTTTHRSSPVAVSTSGVLGGVTVTQIGTRGFETCALSSAGAAYCWGSNIDGGLGDGTTTQRTSPVAVSTSGVLSGVTLTQISAGYLHACALSSAGAAYCWGNNDSGQLGDGTTAQRTSPVAVSTSGVLSGVTLTQISAGIDHTCALSSAGVAFCWGRNLDGELGDGTTTQRTSPVAVSTSGVLSGVTLSRIAAGFAHTCAVSSVGVAYCWGDNGNGQLGDGTTTSRSSPVAVSAVGVLSGVTVTQISAGPFHTCALSSAGAAYCWGANAGQLGDGTTTQRTSPVAVSTGGVLSGVTLSRIATGVDHTCAKSSTRVYCWGVNAYGELGDGSTTQRTSPVQALFPATGPGAPTSVLGVAGDTQVALSWTAPSDLGSGTLTGYTATASPGGLTCTSSGATTCTVTGLTNGTAYTFTVVVATTDGSSSASGVSSAVTPYALPGTPTSVSGVAGDGQVAVSWTAPSTVGTGGIAGYTATASPGGATCTTSSATTCTVTGLTNGTAYTFTAIASNGYGNSGASSASDPVTPMLPAVVLPSVAPVGDSSLHSSAGSAFTPLLRLTTLTGTGFAPGTTVILGIYSTPIQLATATVDGSGNFSVEVTIPAGVSGAHTLVAVGLDPEHAPRSLTLAITVAGEDALATTGPALSGAVGLGLGLLAAGVAAVAGFRRRRTAKIS